MNGYDYSNGRAFDTMTAPPGSGSHCAIICNTSEVPGLMDVFGWDRDTVDECTNLDESVRYTSYDGYDFVSLIYAEAESGATLQREVNIFFSRSYLVLVLPENPGSMLTRLADGLRSAFPSAASRSAPLTYMYYLIFDSLMSDFSDMLERLEDEMESMSETIEQKPDKAHSIGIGRLRKTAYTYKKLLRALSYIGSQALMDENGLLDRNQYKYFRNISTRLIKLYDFADNLCELSSELLRSFDSKFAAQMNETVNKLTIITLFFGPLTVIAGIYGMNFVHMPELKWFLGYPLSLGLMAAVCVVIFLVLKKKKWL